MLDVIEVDHAQNVIECCEEMFTVWLQTDVDASWEKLINALQTPGLKLDQSALQIAKKLGKTVLISVCALLTMHLLTIVIV